MKKQSTKVYRKLILTSSMYIVLAISLLFVSVYAWFTLTNESNASLVSSISGVEAQYEFYIYQNANHEGSNNPTLEDNVCDIGGDLCYEYIPNPTAPYLFDGKVAPGETFSFAIKITSVGTSVGKLRLELGGIDSIGASSVNDEIQQAFSYNVAKISYIEDGIESSDQKDIAPIEYFSQTFSTEINTEYQLVNSVPLGIDGLSNSTVIVYFNVYFDPTIYGFDTYGTPYTNSNIFMSQIFRINYIYMIISA